MEAPEQMIKFKAYKRGRTKRININDHRLTRVCNQKKLPYGVWAKHSSGEYPSIVECLIQ